MNTMPLLTVPAKSVSKPAAMTDLLGSLRRLLISDLCALIETYLPLAEVKEVYRAYLFSAEAHEGQKRLSGEPYIHHPLAVAYILAEMRMDVQTLCAAILHDVIEDTGISKEEITDEFGEDIAELVDGVSKLTKVPLETYEQAQAANFRKMLLAMNRDIRVIIVKLADRLHNMRTLGAMKIASQRRIARETLEIYAPVASRLGMNKVRVALEELSFKTLYPLRHKVLKQRMEDFHHKRLDNVKAVQTSLTKHLSDHGIHAKISERTQHTYSIYRKMREKKGAASTDKKKSFYKVMKTYTFRVVVDNVDACYRSLGIIHSLYKPISERFSDYIAIPKINGYQSLHTVLVSPYGAPIDVHIRTTAMQEMAETGIVTNGLYKFDNDMNTSVELSNQAVRQRASEWLRDLLEMPEISGDSLEFLEHVKMDLFPDEVYVFTPCGKILQLPKGATAIDFAYAVHSDVGNQCIAAKIDQQYLPLSTPLMSGQTVEVVTAAWARPNPSWLNFAVTARARSHILHFLKNIERDQAITLGHRLLDKELSVYNLAVDKLTAEQQQQLLQVYKVDSLDTLLADIGFGHRMALVVARQFDPEPQFELLNHHSKPLMIKGTEGILVNFARCCRPIPYDEIIGFFSAGKGITVHTASCRNIAEFRNHPEKCLPVEWEAGIEGDFLVDIRVEVRNKRGALATVATALANMGSNIEHVANDNRDDFSSTLKFCITVHNRTHLASIIRHLRRFDIVTRIQRTRG